MTLLREMAWSVTADLFCSAAADLLLLRVYITFTCRSETSCCSSCRNVKKLVTKDCHLMILHSLLVTVTAYELIQRYIGGMRSREEA